MVRKMLKFKALYSIIVVIFMTVETTSAESSKRLSFMNFNRLKDDLFAKSNINVSNECLKELNTISSGVPNMEMWAIKILDAWGKMPSGIASGNTHEFGSFSQCFDIERNGEPYNTKYCLAHLSESKDVFEQQGKSRALPKLDIGPWFTFGICLPASCSEIFIEAVINEVIQENTNDAYITVPKNTCQYYENPTTLTALDKSAFIFFGMFMFLLLASTSYDILQRMQQSKRSPLLSAFSVYTNGLKLFSCNDNESSGTMDCLNGIRVITTQWVILGHTFLFFRLMPIQNTIATISFFSAYRDMIILSAPISVDTFFVISGLLLSMNMLKHLNKTNGRMNIPLLYLHRYLRLTPLLAVTILSSICLLRFLGNGPVWPIMNGYFSDQCVRNWWRALLYIQNYSNPEDICLSHTWYLAVDTQLFLIAPLLMYLIYRYKAKVFVFFVFMILGCIGLTVSAHVDNDIKGLLSDLKMEMAYFPTHLRFSSWLIGIMAGYIFFESQNKKIHIPKILNIVAWIMSLSVMAMVIFINQPLQRLDSIATPMQYGLYDALSRIFWSIALCYIIFACVHNHGGPINAFLAHPLWQPLSRMSYSIYLLHFLTIMVTMASMKSPLHFSEFTGFFLYIGNSVLTVLAATVATLAFESPIISLEKLFFASKTESKNSNKHQQHPIQYEKIERNSA